MRVRLITAALALALCGAAPAATPAADAKREAARVYLVALEGAPLAAWRGGTAQGKRYAPTDPAVTGHRKL
ncbi:MAG TPA: hypothetical protein VND91_13155, partial [Candidatus Saccharimonadia bacterium]|nr:hypothetical protein [Candidatus Saccharimonadia bacterium]